MRPVSHDYSSHLVISHKKYLPPIFLNILTLHRALWTCYTADVDAVDPVIQAKGYYA